MFAELCTEAGPVEMARAEAIATDTPDTYTFIWRGVPAVIEADVPLFVRVYTTRMYGACFGMMAIPEHDLIHQDSNLEVTWYIKIPFTAGSKDLGRVA